MTLSDQEFVLSSRAVQEKLGCLTLEDLAEKDREVAEILGVEKLVLLSQVMGGTPYYIPQPENLAKMRIRSEIRKAYDGTNIKRLAAEYGVCTATIYNILKGMLIKGAEKRKIKENIPGQQELMDWMPEAVPPPKL